MDPRRPARKWMQVLAAALLLALGPGVTPSRAEEAALGGARTTTLPVPFDDDGDLAAIVHASHSAELWALAVDLSKINSSTPPSPGFCGASPRAPPSA